MGGLAMQALYLIERSSVKSQHVSANRVPATQVAAIWDTKRRIGKLKKEAFFGLDESISSLSESRSDVQLGCVETESGFIAIWFVDDIACPVGIIGADSTKILIDERK
jgi:hypothetical protein